MEKIKSFKEVIRLSNSLQRKGKTVGLVLGSFDILHMGHINLFKLSKKRTDFLIVGLDNDETIRKTKGAKRPVNNYFKRSRFLSELSSVDYIFRIDSVYKHGDKASFICLQRILTLIKPNMLLTSVRCDELWKEKKELADTLYVKFVPEKSMVTHTSEIIKILESEL